MKEYLRAIAEAAPCDCGGESCGGNAVADGHRFGELLLCDACGIAIEDYHAEPAKCEGQAHLPAHLDDRAQLHIEAFRWESDTRLCWPLPKQKDNCLILKLKDTNKRIHYPPWSPGVVFSRQSRGKVMREG